MFVCPLLSCVTLRVLCVMTHAVFVIANEGDAREYGEEDTPTFYADETRVADLAEEAGIDIAGTLYDEAVLGRLKVRMIDSSSTACLSTMCWGREEQKFGRKG